MKALRIALIALVCTAPLAALSQWQWVDKDGRKVFSDKAPPPEVPANKILRQPGQRAPSADVAVDVPAATATAAVPKGTGTDKALEQRKQQAEAAEAAKKKAEEQKIAAVKADNCDRARKHKAMLDSGVRVGRINANGEREVMDDATRASEMKAAETAIARDCQRTQ